MTRLLGVPLLVAGALIAPAFVAACQPVKRSVNARAPVGSPERVHFETRDGGVIHADLYGAGERGIVLAHGGRFDKESWAKQARELAAAGFHVLAFDFRGYGESRGPGQADIFTAPLHLDVLGGVGYLRTRGATSVAAIGGSMGGGAIASAVIAEPDRIDRAVFLGATPDGSPEALRIPKLYIATRDDASGSGPRLPGLQAHFEKTPDPKELILLDGSAHAQFMFETGHADRVMQEILRFLSAQVDAVTATRAYRTRHGPRILRDFADLLAIPNVASDSTNIRRNAVRLVELLTAHGARAKLLTLAGTSAPPIVYGRIDVPGATRTVGIYVHYDGQPTNPDEWAQGPWEPTLYTRSMTDGGTPRTLPRDGEAVDPEWRIYARSASDDKAPLGALLPVLRALREAGIQPTSNLVFFFDGEEEAGSRHLGRYFDAHRDLVDDIDLWLLLDGPVHQSGRPQLVFGVRGVTSLEITVYGAARELHSGHYGNWAPVPGRLLAELLASMYRPDGTVAVEGFYDSVEPLDELSRAALEALPRFDEEIRRELGLAATEGGGRLDERILQPSLTIHGLRSADVGGGARNVIPAQATASLGIRLVKGNDVVRMQELVEAHIRRQGFHVVRDEPDKTTRLAHGRIARVIRGSGYPAARTRMDDPHARAVVAGARRVAGDDLLLVPGLGGSLPLYLFTDVLAKPSITVPVANHDNNQHAANENLRIANLWYAMDVYAALITMR